MNAPNTKARAGASDRITGLQSELLAICRGSYAYETWAKVTEQPINERADWRGRMAGQRRVDEIRREIHGINPDAALYFGWGPDEHPQAQAALDAAVAAHVKAGRVVRLWRSPVPGDDLNDALQRAMDEAKGAA